MNILNFIWALVGPGLFMGISNTRTAVVGDIIAMEVCSSKFATSGTLATGGSLTIPANTGDIWCYPSEACHWNPNGTATSTTGPSHAVRAAEMFMIRNSQIAAAEIIGDAGAITTVYVAYMRGSRKLAHAVVRPY